MTDSAEHTRGQLRPAPESFLSAELVADISAHGVNEQRRGLLKGAFATALAGMAGMAGATDSDPDIVNVPEWSKILGKPVAANPYGLPSKYEANIIRRQSPGLT